MDHQAWFYVRDRNGRIWYVVDGRAMTVGGDGVVTAEVFSVLLNQVGPLTVLEFTDHILDHFPEFNSQGRERCYHPTLFYIPEDPPRKYDSNNPPWFRCGSCGAIVKSGGRR